MDTLNLPIKGKLNRNTLGEGRAAKLITKAVSNSNLRIAILLAVVRFQTLFFRVAQPVMRLPEAQILRKVRIPSRRGLSAPRRLVAR